MNNAKPLEVLIEETEHTLREQVGSDITDDLVFNGFETTLSAEPQVKLYIGVHSAFADGDDSTDAFQDANGIEETFKFLQRLGLTSDQRIRFTF